MSPLDKLLGDGGPKCKVYTPDVSVHWFATDAKPGDPCLCGEVVKRDDEDEA